MKYRRIIATHPGRPEVLQVVESELRPPSTGEVRIRTLASAVCQPDLSARSGQALYSGTPLGQKFPFTPGYALIGRVDALGSGVSQPAVGQLVGALTVTGSYSEYLTWKADRLIPIPDGLDPVEAVVLILNYVVAYQTLHRSARVHPGGRLLIVGASGGIGTALLQLGRLAGQQMIGTASPGKHAILREYGAEALDYHAPDWMEAVRAWAPAGLDTVISGVTRLQTIRQGLSLLRSRGKMVCYGEPKSRAELLAILGRLLTTRWTSGGRSLALYGTSTYFLGDRRPYLEDWALLFRLLQEGKIKPVIEHVYPLVEAAQANARLESGEVTGNLVLVAPDA